MSDKQKFPREQVLPVAQEIYERLAPFVLKCKVAGSLRRYRRFVSDIEVLFIPKHAPKQQGLFENEAEEIDLADLNICRWEYEGYLKKRLNSSGHACWGKQNKLAIHAASNIPVDFFATTPANWFVALVIRTGGKVTNLQLTTGAQKRGLSLNAYGSGFTRLSDQSKIACNSERDVFRHAGVPYLEPANRP